MVSSGEKSNCNQFFSFTITKDATENSPLHHREPTDIRVLLIYTPGCFILDNIMETLRQCLQCWGVKHVETMFDNDGYEIDQCGGIPSYLKEKIDNIDYAVLMFTQLFKGKGCSLAADLFTYRNV